MDGGLYFYQFNYNKDNYCIYCNTKHNREPNETDYLWLTCSNCHRIFFLEPKNRLYIDKLYQDLQLKLNNNEIDDLIDIALDSKDKQWFYDLLAMKSKIVNGWAITKFRQSEYDRSNEL